MSRKSRKNPKTMPVVSQKPIEKAALGTDSMEWQELKAEQEKTIPKTTIRDEIDFSSNPYYDACEHFSTPKHYTMADIAHLERRIDALTAQTCMCIRSNEPRYTLDEFLAMPVETFLNAEWFAALLKKAIAQVERENHGD
jgi:hypothetical protein